MYGASQVVLVVTNEPACQYRSHKRRVWSLGWKEPLKEGVANLSSILAWRITWVEEPGGL